MFVSLGKRLKQSIKSFFYSRGFLFQAAAEAERKAEKLAGALKHLKEGLEYAKENPESMETGNQLYRTEEVELYTRTPEFLELRIQ